jgi:hypothetical protein
LINGFSNKDGNLYIYDKVKDEIKQKARSPKSLFFEEHRNTIEVKDGITSSLLEDFVYQDIDNKASKAIRDLQLGNIQHDDLLKFSNFTILQFFLISLFWRLPYTDFAVDGIFDDAKIVSDGIDPEILRNDETFRKMYRAGLILETFKSMGKDVPSLSSYSNIFESKEDSFVIGDYPILYERLPHLFSDLADLEFIFAVSSKRVCLSTYKRYEKFTDTEAIIYNALIIDQSKIMICSGNKSLLEKSVYYYKKFTKDGSLIPLRHIIFRKQFKM